MRYSYALFQFNKIIFSIHILYILLIIITPIATYLIFNPLTSLAILQFLLLLSLSILLHELGHAYVARRYKIYFQEILLLPLGGISIRKSMPENTFDEYHIALTSLGVYLAIVLMMLPLIFYLYGFEAIITTRIYDFSPIIIFFQINIGLLIFNLIPLYPLDAGRILRSYLTHKYDYHFATRIVTWMTYIFGAILIILGLYFGIVLVILILFLYIGTQSKGKFDEAAEVLSVGDKDTRARARLKYQATRRSVIRRTKQIQSRAELMLGESRIGILAKIFFKLRNYFDIDLTKGKLTWLREMLISILPLILHIKNLIKLWLMTHAVQKSIFFMLIATICLTMIWLLPPIYMIIFGVGFLLSFSFGAFIIYYHTRSRKLLIFTLLGCLSWLIFLTLDLFEPLLELSYWGILYLEGIRGCMIPLTGIMFFAAIVNSNNFFKKSRAHMPFPAFVLISTLYLIGTFVLFYEIYLLSAYETNLDTIRFTLRYDIAYLIWFFASFGIFGSVLYLLYIGSITRYGRVTTVKVTTATVVIILLLSFFTRDLLFMMLGRFSTEPDEINLRVGLHSNNITELDESEFDKFFHLEVKWSGVYKEGPGRADWSKTDWQINYAARNEIDIYFLINPIPPKWFIKEHPDAIMRDQWNATFFWIDEDPSKPSGKRIWDLSFNDPSVVEAKLNFTLEALRRYQNYSVIKYISIQNEPTYPVDFNHISLASYDPITVSEFREWITQLYNNDTQVFMNKTGVKITKWSEINAPRNTTDRLWDQWLRFREDSLIAFVEKLTTGVRNNTDKPVTVKIMGHFLARFQIIQTGLSERVIKQFIKLSDVVSLDIYPLTIADLQSGLDFYKNLAGDKPIILSEFNLVLGSNFPGSGSLFYYNLILINNYADAVIVFTGNDHYIYGINLYSHTPVHLGLKMFKLHRADEDIFSLYDELLLENLRSIPNYYGIFVFACTVWNLPIIPWPILLLVMLPVPIAEKKKRSQVKKIMYGVILGLLILFFIVSNLT